MEDRPLWVWNVTIDDVAWFDYYRAMTIKSTHVPNRDMAISVYPLAVVQKVTTDASHAN